MGDTFGGQSVRLPFIKGAIPVVVNIEDHPAIANIKDWPKEIKGHLAAACFRSDQDKVESIGSESLPRIRRAAEVWKHLTIRCIGISPKFPEMLRADVVPAWDEEEHMEWCIKNGKVIYVGQFLGYSIDGYEDITSGNFA